MKKRSLAKPPLVEAIFEVKWDISKIKQDVKKDSSLVAGILSDKIKSEYPYHEPLDAAKIPEDFVSGIVQYRFRAGEGKSPLVQIGSGVFTVNHINEGISPKYDWDDFKARCSRNYNDLVSFYPISGAVNSILLRYINAIEFDFEKENIFKFLSERLKINISMPENFSSEANLEEKPLNFNFSFTYPCSKPVGSLKVFFSSGKMNTGKDSLVWHIEFMAKDLKVPELPSELEKWLEDSHLNIEEAFFNLVEKLETI